MAKTVEEIADAMFKLVEDARGLKKLKPTDLNKAMVQLYGDEVDKKMCKAAIKELINSGRCIYTYFGGSFIEIPYKEGSAND
uniref:Dissimilatory sulfite reductase subunit D (DsrD) n=1 Tax=uncultured sulfate-reducing bacterium TaxID=153939 RepID=Q3IBL6_9BACT|nr:dissimilatory sulfite reductase subunit D (DsrD) [uncultured sulfate-reducing bacterium]